MAAEARDPGCRTPEDQHSRPGLASSGRRTAGPSTDARPRTISPVRPIGSASRIRFASPRPKAASTWRPGCTEAGLTGQADAIRLGLARALLAHDEELRAAAPGARAAHPGCPQGRAQEAGAAQGAQAIPVQQAIGYDVATAPCDPGSRKRAGRADRPARRRCPLRTPDPALEPQDASRTSSESATGSTSSTCARRSSVWSRRARRCAGSCSRARRSFSSPRSGSCGRSSRRRPSGAAPCTSPSAGSAGCSPTSRPSAARSAG